MFHRIVVGLLFLGCCLLIGNRSLAADEFSAELFNTWLAAGDLDAAAKNCATVLQADPEHNQAQYALGVVRMLQSVEQLSQDLYRHGLTADTQFLPILRLPLPNNPKPKVLTYAEWRALLQRFVDNLDNAAEQLEQVDTDDTTLRLLVKMGGIRCDLDGDGAAEENEAFWKIFVRVTGMNPRLPAEQQAFPVGFDAGDVHWMIGYTHLLRALVEMWLAHDTERFFQRTSPYYFQGNRAPLTKWLHPNQREWETSIVNAVAAIHLFNFEVVEPERMSAARQHLLAMVKQSRETWVRIKAETDDEREWIPNSQQTSLVGLQVTNDRINAWAAVIDEMEAVLEGRKLLPHWRISGPRDIETPFLNIPAGINIGINMKKVFEEPRRFDLIMWVHGEDAVPYLEIGDVVTQDAANQLTGAFRGQFWGFAVWFN